MSDKSPSRPRPHYGAEFRKRYMGCPEVWCFTLADHAGHDPIGPEHPDGYPGTERGLAAISIKGVNK